MWQLISVTSWKYFGGTESNIFVILFSLSDFISIILIIISYIKQQISLTGNNPIKLTHKEIANNLGTSREVVSRVLKKIENEGEITQTANGIEITLN